MKAIKDEFNLYPVLRKLEDYFSKYLEDVEKLIDNKTKELDSIFDRRVQELELKQDSFLDRNLPNWRDDIVYSSLEEDYEKIYNVFPNLLRRSLFIYVYSVLEDALNNCCRLLNYQGRVLKDVKADDKSIRRAKKYLEDADVKFPVSNEWNEILCYQKLRNCITHNQGRVKGCSYEKDIRNFILKNSHLSLMYTDDEGKDVEGMSEFVEIIFHKGFCEEVIQTISNFLEQLRISMEHRHRNEDF